MQRRTLYRNGHVYVPTRGRPTAMLVEGPRVLWVGPEADADALAADAQEVVDLQGRLVTAPFVDGLHYLGQTSEILASVPVGGCRSREQTLDAIAAACRTSPVPLLVAGEYDENLWPDFTPPTPDELAAAVDGRPFLLHRVGRSGGVVTPALREATAAVGIDVSGWGDELTRDQVHDAGFVLGALRDRAGHRATMVPMLQLLAAHGVAAVHAHLPSQRSALDIRHDPDLPPLPVVHSYLERICPPDDDPAEIVRELGLRGLLVQVDGPASVHRASLREPYIDTPGYAGPDPVPARAIADHLVVTSRAGVQTSLVCAGDRSADEVVQALRESVRSVGLDRFRARGHRVFTMSLADSGVLGTLVDLGVHVGRAPQTEALMAGPDGVLTRRLGPSRTREHTRLGSLAVEGLRTFMASLAPLGGIDPWETLRAARRHRDESERVSVGESFRAHTVGGWAAAGVDHRGYLDQGLPADYVVWDLDEELLDHEPSGPLCTPGLPTLAPGTPLPTALLTVVGGRVIHQIEGALS